MGAAEPLTAVAGMELFRVCFWLQERRLYGIIESMRKRFEITRIGGPRGETIMCIPLAPASPLR